jgi:hypothetical protein
VPIVTLLPLSYPLIQLPQLPNCFAVLFLPLIYQGDLIASLLHALEELQLQRRLEVWLV